MSAPRVSVTALLSVRDELGWGHQEVELTGSSLRDLLRTLRTRTGGDLEQTLCDGNGKLRDCYVVMINGSRVKEADAPLRADDRVVTLEFFRAVAGG